MLGNFHNFSIKIKYFEAFLDLNFCFETYFDNGIKKITEWDGRNKVRSATEKYFAR